ncbi:hypothetical protein CYY_005676 [Polysphondylium violaceum]|uniref:WH2 domain-containing protein n=1 Tax=Polysphondylium violaceum TaxID=133409 RepID=A0A8J4PSI0_9MYCE|nr:hypothetical protein CYY_005676 [Polysphondylium violaceum]
MPPPPPPPPPKAPPPPVSTPPPKTGERSALLNSIQKGTKLKKTTTNDRSQPQTVAPKPTPGGGGPMGMPMGGGFKPSGGGAKPSESHTSSAPQLGGLFAGGMPQLKPSGGTLKKAAPPPMMQPVQAAPPTSFKPTPPPSFKPTPPPMMNKPTPPPPSFKPTPPAPMMNKPTPPPSFKPTPPAPMMNKPVAPPARPPPPPTRGSVSGGASDEELRAANEKIQALEAQVRDANNKIRQLEADLAKAKTSKPAGRTAVALYDYSSDMVGDLQFKATEVISIKSVDGDWATGEKTGTFPANYVQMQ